VAAILDSDLVEAMARFRACIVLTRNRIVVAKNGAAEKAGTFLELSERIHTGGDAIEGASAAALARQTLGLMASINGSGASLGARPEGAAA
jgi:hypothetical protein